MSSDLHVTAPLPDPKQIPKSRDSRLPPSALSIPRAVNGPHAGHWGREPFSPVNQNGSFEFDRVLKNGEVYKRTRKTKQWKSFYLVLRPNLLSVYKNASESRLHKQISLSELTAVAYLKDPKGRRQNVFGLFSPSRNFHLQAKDEQDARSWVELINREARIDEVEQEMLLGSPLAASAAVPPGVVRGENERWEQDRLGSSSPEPLDFTPRHSTTRDGVSIPGARRRSTHEWDYSGDDLGRSSDFSDTAPAQGSSPYTADPRSIVHRRILSESKPNRMSVPATSSQLARPGTAGEGSQVSIFPMDPDDERVIWHGYLLYLKSKGGVRQWKRHWVVLRSKNLAFYKSEQEYAADLIIPLSNIISAVEIDPVSKSKRYCMQIIAEVKTYRFCALSEDALAQWLGALKSQLARKKEASYSRNP
ncbi:hypothetical protein MMC07_009966 [Pseudocyphellaria aurata]|nr:hypothetical protein [Pseudocyphellaria aurata]